MRWLWILLFGCLLFLTGIQVSNAPAQQSVTPPVAVPCQTGTSSVCNPSPQGYYAQSTATPEAMATTVAGTGTPNPTANSQGRYSEIVDPQTDSILHFVYMSPAAATSGVKWDANLAEYNLRNNTFLSNAVIESVNCSNSGQTHDYAGLIPGPNGEMGIPFGSISAAFRNNGSNGCTASKNMCSNSGCSQGSGTANWNALPMKFALPTASPSAVAADTQYYAPMPDDPSEIWTVCFTINPGDPNTWANEARRCLVGGQAQEATFQLNGQGNSVSWLYQTAGSMHWGTGLRTPWFDTINCTGYTGSACGTNGSSCPASGRTTTYALLGALSPCYDPINSAIGTATDGNFHLTYSAGDATYKIYMFTAVTASGAVSFTTQSFPSGTPVNTTAFTCNFTQTAGGSETVNQMVVDMANTLNNNSNNGTTSDGSTLNAATCSDTGTITTWRTFMEAVASPNSSFTPAAGYSTTGANNVSGLTCTAANPCLILRVKDNATYNVNYDTQTAAWVGASFSGSASCTNCTVTAGSGQGQASFTGFQVNPHNNVGNCKLLTWYGEEGICLFMIDHTARGPYTSLSEANTSYGLALKMACFNKNSYTVAATPTWTFRTCDLNNAVPAGTFTISADNALTNGNPANMISEGIPQGGRASATCNTVWEVCNPTTSTGTFYPFTFDMDGLADPIVVANSNQTQNIAVFKSQDVTNMSTGNLLVGATQAEGNSGTVHVTATLCIYNITTRNTDRCDQLDPSNQIGGTNADGANISMFTGASGTIYIFIATGNAGTVHGCTTSCVLEYSLTPAQQTVFPLNPTFLGVTNFSGCGATIAAPGSESADQEGGYHVIDWQTCLTSSTVNTLYEFDNIIP